MLILSKITMTYKNNQAFFYNCLKFNHKDIIKELISPIFHTSHICHRPNIAKPQSVSLLCRKEMLEISENSYIIHHNDKLKEF